MTALTRAKVALRLRQLSAGAGATAVAASSALGTAGMSSASPLRAEPLAQVPALVSTFDEASSAPRVGTGTLSDGRAWTASVTPTRRAQVSISSKVVRHLPHAFSGFNDADLKYATRYTDPRYQEEIAKLDPTWLRFPGGTVSDVFDWRSGEVPDRALARFTRPDQHAMFRREQEMLAGKGGAHLSDFAQLTHELGAQAVMQVNGFTDTPASAAALARRAQALGIPVGTWELSNEAYLFKSFFPSATDYLDKMRPYAEAIRSVDPHAKIAVAMSRGGKPSDAWDRATASYAHPFWNTVVVHSYPGHAKTFDATVPLTNEALKNLGHSIHALSGSTRQGTSIVYSEFNAGLLGSPVVGTLYNGIYAAEFLARTSTHPAVSRVGLQAVYGGDDDFGAIRARYPHQQDVLQAGRAGKVLDPSTLDFGFYLSPQGLAMEVANPALRGANRVLETKLRARGTVKAGKGTMPAVHAQAYARPDGSVSVLLTNKSGKAHRAQLDLAGVPTPSSTSS